jgi:UDP-2,3-diacylglucosamine pyrophosphatase LpxH
MRIAILPDLHITSEGYLSPFYLTDDEFYSVLSSIEADRVFCVGDTFDLWRSKFPTNSSQDKELNRICQIYPKTIGYFLNSPKFGGIAVGNHDNYLLKLPDNSEWKKVVFEEIVLLNSKNQKIILSHGHLDFFNKVFPFVGQLVTWASAWLERIFIRNSKIYRFLRNTAKSHVFRNSAQIKVMRKRIDTDDQIVCIVNGHTHKPQITHFYYKSFSRLYINAGFFDGKVQDIIILDTETLEISKSPVTIEDYTTVNFVIQRGDVILSNNRINVFSAAIRYTTDGEYTHSMVYMGNGQIIESIPGQKSGVQVGYMEKYFNGDYDLCVLRLKDLSKVEPFLQVLYSKLGRNYGYLQILINLVYFLVKKIFRIDIKRNLTAPDGGVTCSTLVAESLFQVVDSTIRPEVYSPQNLKNATHLFDTIYIIRSKK